MDAERVVRKLARHGHKAYLVGGCVRDLLLGRTPKDFDVATSATPNEIRDLFRNCRIIGRRFRLAHIYFGPKIIETSTFRANPRHDDRNTEGLLIRRDNVFGSDTEDARRRDFTINGLFFNVETEQVIDYVGGLQDLEARLVRTIGDPDIRFQEDPVRMLRAIKFAARLDFEIEPNTYEAILRHRGQINHCAPPRVLEEFYRLLRGGAARRSMMLLTETGMDEVLTSRLAAMFREPCMDQGGPDIPRDEEEAQWMATWAEERSEQGTLELSFADPHRLARQRLVAWKVLDLLDQMAAQGQDLSNALLLAAIMSPFLEESLLQPGVRPGEASAMIVELAHPLIDKLRVARRDTERMRQILLAQRRLAPSRRRRGRPMALARRDFFDEALTVYEITARAAGRDTADVEYWRELQREGNGPARDDDEGRGKRRRRRRGGRRRRRTEPMDPSDLSATFGH